MVKKQQLQNGNHVPVPVFVDVTVLFLFYMNRQDELNGLKSLTEDYKI